MSILHFYIFTFLHEGPSRGTKSWLKTAYYVQNLDSRRLILHFNIFTSGSVQGSRTCTQDGFFCPMFRPESRRLILHFRFLHFHIRISPEVQTWTRHVNFTFSHFFILTWGSVEGYKIWAQDSLLCPKSGLETANFTFLHFYIGVCRPVQNLDSRRLILSNIWTRYG